MMGCDLTNRRFIAHVALQTVQEISRINTMVYDELGRFILKNLKLFENKKMGGERTS